MVLFSKMTTVWTWHARVARSFRQTVTLRLALRKQLREREDVDTLGLSVVSFGALVPCQLSGNAKLLRMLCLSLCSRACGVHPSPSLSSPLSVLLVASLRCKPTSTPLVLHQLFLLLPKGVRMLPPTLLVPSPPLPDGRTNGDGKESSNNSDGGAQSRQVLPRQPTVLGAQEKLSEALAHELLAARALWEPTVCSSKFTVDFSHSSLHATKYRNIGLLRQCPPAAE